MIQFNKLTASRDIPALLTLFPVPKPEASYGSQAKNSCRKSKMSKRAKSKETISTSESDESGDDRKEKKKKQKRQPPSESDDEDETVWELGKKRKVSINNFKGRMLIDIREYYEAGDGTEKPGKKGISLSVDQWKKLKEIIPKVDKAIS